jgi:hypothetical protein
MMVVIDGNMYVAMLKWKKIGGLVRRKKTFRFYIFHRHKGTPYIKLEKYILIVYSECIFIPGASSF